LTNFPIKRELTGHRKGKKKRKGPAGGVKGKNRFHKKRSCGSLWTAQRD